MGKGEEIAKGKDGQMEIYWTRGINREGEVM